jgi:hypothetical protein
MKRHLIYLALAALTGPAAVSAQEPKTPAPAPADTQPSHSTPQSEAGEPRASTSPQSEAGEPRASTSPQSEAGEPRAATSPDVRPSTPSPPRGGSAAAAPHAGPTPRGQAAEAPAKGGKPGVDRLELGTATVTGDREQPKVLYIVPWKRSDIGDLSGKPMNSLLDEALAPVDRDEFKRQVVYYQAVKADASQNGAKPPAQQGEK